MTASKLATREYLGYEEEEDALLPIASIVRDAIVRRMARTSDASILGGVTAPFTSLGGLAGGNSGNTVTGATAGAVTVAEIASMRKEMGVWGMNPSDLVVFLSQTAYYGLLTSTEVITVDKYGDNATIKSGELGKLFGMSLVVSDAMPAAMPAIVVNPSNYLIGTYKGLTVETATDVVAQQKAMVATRRFGFIAKEAGAAAKASMNNIVDA
jgi:HK97 family phage major capsid protein